MGDFKNLFLLQVNSSRVPCRIYCIFMRKKSRIFFLKQLQINVILDVEVAGQDMHIKDYFGFD